MKPIIIFTLSLTLSFQTFAKDWEQMVMIDEATCSYDQYGSPRIKIAVSPPITVDGKKISKFTNGRTPEMCPRMNEISDRLYANVTLQNEEESFYAFDKNGICNRYETKTLLMFIPVHASGGRRYLAMLSPIKKTLKERNLSIGNCTGGH